MNLRDHLHISKLKKKVTLSERGRNLFTEGVPVCLGQKLVAEIRDVERNARLS